jgi:hypothetical protein
VERREETEQQRRTMISDIAQDLSDIADADAGQLRIHPEPVLVADLVLVADPVRPPVRLRPLLAHTVRSSADRVAFPHGLQAYLVGR